MQIGNRIPNTSCCIFKCDRCNKEWKGYYYITRKKDIQLCPSCACKEGWKNKHSLISCNIPEDIRHNIKERVDGISLDVFLPKNKSIKLIVYCKECENEYQTNAYDLFTSNFICNSCSQKKAWLNPITRTKYIKTRQTKEYRDNMSDSVKSSIKYRNTITQRGEQHKKYWENIRGCKLEDIKTEWELYRVICYRISERHYKRYKSIINPDNLPRGKGKYHLDHRYSIMRGFKNNIPPYIISHIYNLQMLLEKDNISKDYHCDITKEELFKGIFDIKEINGY
jgi:hypothetical protein